MPYAVTVWVNGGAPALSKANLDNLETQYDSAMGDIIHHILKTANETVNNSVVLQNDNELVIAVAANEVLLIDLLIYYVSDAAQDFKFAFTVPVAATLTGITRLGTASDFNYNDDMTGAHARTVANANDKYIHYLMHYIGGVNAGNVQLQWAQNAAVVADTIVYAGSYMIGFKPATL